MALRWGIASAGFISHDFVTALRLLPAGEHEAVAVAARSLESARKFASAHGIKSAYGGYESLARDPDVQIVYIGSLNPQHYEIAVAMLEGGKHVLCEKPLCMNHKQAEQLVKLARSKKLFLMEAVWSRFFPAYVHLREYIKAGKLGEVVRVSADFGVPIKTVDRLKKKELGGGTVLDLGIYTLQFAQMVFGTEPVEILATGELNEDGVDLAMSCILKYKNGAVAMLSTLSECYLPNVAVVVGTKGIIKLNSTFWCPTSIEMPDGTVKEFPLPTGGTFNFTNSAGLGYEAAECRRCIMNGLTESSVMSLDESLMLAKLEDAIRKQIGVHYPQDD